MPNIFQRMGGAIGRVFGRGSGETADQQQPQAAPRSQEREAAPPIQPQQEERRGLRERVRNIFQPGRAEREQAERQRQEQERQLAERERQVAARERQLEERAARDRAELQRQVQEQLQRALEADRRARQEDFDRRQRQERERQAQPQPTRPAEPVAGIPELGIAAVSGGRGFTIYGLKTPEQVMEKLKEFASIEGKRASLIVHDKNGWHHLYTNKGRDAGKGMSISATDGQSGMLDRFQRDGVPGQEAVQGPVTTDYEGAGQGDGSQEEEDGGPWDDYDDYGDGYDVGDSDGGDDGDTEGIDMNIGQLIQTLIATIVGSIIGGLIVISTNWIKEKGERRRATQERYEQIYIIEGIDPLAAYYQSLSLNIINKANDRTISIVEKDIPVEAITKVRILLVDVVPLNIIFRAHAHLANTDDRDMLGSVASLMQDAVEALINYRIQLTAKILISVNSLQHERETTQLTSELNEVWSGLAYLEKQRLNEEREARAQLKLPDLPAMRKRKDRFPRIK